VSASEATHETIAIVGDSYVFVLVWGRDRSRVRRASAGTGGTARTDGGAERPRAGRGARARTGRND
jgi:hypothetical protein